MYKGIEKDIQLIIHKVDNQLYSPSFATEQIMKLLRQNENENETEENENFIQNKFGYCFYAIEKDYALIYNLFVHPEYRRNGHSKTLLNYVIAEIKKSNIEEIRIEANPREDCISIDKLTEYYESMGFKII